MFFESEMISFNLLDVLSLKQKNVHTYNSKRNYNALSFRFKADTILKSKSEIYNVKDNCISFVPSRLDYSRIAKTDELIAIHFEATHCNANRIECFEPANPELFKKLFTVILECWRHKEVGYKYKCSATFYEILALCYAENHKQKRDETRIQKSIDYLLEHYRDCDVSIPQIAERSFVSEVYFRKLFKAEYGVSPQKHISRLRIQYAKELISSGYYSLKEIALMSGYADYKYFSVAFKKQVGVSPSDYFYNYSQ